MLSINIVRELLAPFDLKLSDVQIDSLLQYLGLLLQWNQKINLTSIRTAENCITRHFGESLLVCKAVPMRGRLLDIGSGAGFPGLAIKLLAPDLSVVLLEPATRKRAFLKEVARSCGINNVVVVGSRIQDFARQERLDYFDIITARAIGALETLIPVAARLLQAEGWLCVWLGKKQLEEARKAGPKLQWKDPLPIPMSCSRYILAGQAPRRW